MRMTKTLVATGLSLVPMLALAHPGHAENGWLAGLEHPLNGGDHLLAMLAVGLWAAQQMGVARWALPIAFLISLAFGALLGIDGVHVVFLESGISASVVALGLAIAVAARPPLWLAIVITATFGALHGVAHGLELPTMANPWAYAAGFMLASAALHGVGYALARYLPQVGAPLLRWAGAGMALIGAGWMFA